MIKGPSRNVTYFIATGFGSGNLPIAPGTWGSIVGLVLSLIAYIYDFLGLFCILAFSVGWFVCELIIREKTEETDPSYIVIDEIAGMALTFWFATQLDLPFVAILILSFTLFRLFDIWKPFPINWIEKQMEEAVETRSFGIMIDDILAAAFAALLMLVITSLLGTFWI
jgi:phosphatidylglycerophosphatase A